MGPAQAIWTSLRRYFQFSGRATRSEFWWFASFVIFLCSIAYQLDRQSIPAFAKQQAFAASTTFLAIPLVAAVFRRLHDAGFSSKLLLLMIIAEIAVLGIFSFPAWQVVENLAGTYEDAAGASISGLILGFGLGRLMLLILAPLPVLLLWKSDPGLNRYGPPPAEVTP